MTMRMKRTSHATIKGVRMSKELMDRIDAWRITQPSPLDLGRTMNLSEAVRTAIAGFLRQQETQQQH